MIVLSSYSKGWCENNNISSTGVEIQNDSLVLIPISELKLSNIKMTELKYEKIINDSLCSIINNNSTIIREYRNVVSKNIDEIKHLTQKNNNTIRQRNVAIGISIALFIGFLLK